MSKRSKSRSKSRDADKKKQGTSKAEKNTVNYDWVWKQDGTLIYGDCGTTPSSKIASFDMDDTIIRVKSGAKFAKDAADWIFWHDTKIVEKMKQLADEGYKIVIFTNQNGISLGKTQAAHIKTKIQNLSKTIGVKLQAFIASADDKYRKPAITMWEMLSDKNNGKQKIDLEKSFFCGDAAGRKTKTHKDFSDTDLLFAKNIGVTFKTPEVFFLDEKQEELIVKGFDGSTIATQGSIFEGEKANSVKPIQKEMIIFCGSPGSGKSTFWQNYLNPHYERINRDTLKTKEKCFKAAEQEMKNGKSVVIDNTNPLRQDRAYFLQLAKKYGYKARCFYFTSNKDICFHNDAIRSTTNKRQHLSGKAGKIAIHGWFKKLEQPKAEQGFSEVKKVNFIAIFNDDADKKAYQSITKGK